MGARTFPGSRDEDILACKMAEITNCIDTTCNKIVNASTDFLKIYNLLAFATVVGYELSNDK